MNLKALAKVSVNKTVEMIAMKDLLSALISFVPATVADVAAGE